MLEELFCAHRAELTAYCRGLCRSDAAAQDMVQEVFLRAWQNIGTLQDLGPSQRRAWLYRTARNLFVDAMRRTAREAAALPELEPEPETPDPDFAEAEARRHCWYCPGYSGYYRGKECNQNSEIRYVCNHGFRAGSGIQRTIRTTE